MLQTFVCWAWIFITAYLTGFAVRRILGRRSPGCDMDLVFGLCILTVYAQVFSLFLPVSLAATILLGGICLVIVIAFRKALFETWKLCLKRRYIFWKICGVAALVLITGLLLTRGPGHYDTDLYHAQSIRWIEEYGVAPGIGNLHNRLAYNSSFFCLQALFSFHFIEGQSMYSVNGFIAVLMLSYALLSMKFMRKKKIVISDFFRIGMILYLCNGETYTCISSPGTDLLAMTLVIYILSKWMDFWEEGEKKETYYSQLCLLAVYAMSVKLSTAMLVLLALTPALRLMRGKKWTEAAVYVSGGLMIALPWLIRNVIISGYIIYPYPELDIFDVDWKMPAYTLLFDRYEIRAWGQGLNDVYRFDASVREWFPLWFGKLQWSMKILLGCNVIVCPGMILTGVWRGGSGRRDWNHLQIVTVIMACIAVWLIGSPLPRYGSAYLLLLPLYAAGCGLEGMKKQMLPNIMLFSTAALAVYGISTWAAFGLESDQWKNHKREYVKYAEYECEEHVLEGGITVYTPAAGDQAGYYDFPSTPYEDRLGLIELRGDSLEDGFRMRKEYRNGFVSTYGRVETENMFAE
ncbi:MAG: hypothetical protein HFH82_05060 [Lachnospiraceae bacterium]|nr:hypothetical protein [Lachnospiraceae bacterium]